MKNIILIALLSVAFVGCGNSNENSLTKNTVENPASDSMENYFGTYENHLKAFTEFYGCYKESLDEKVCIEKQDNLNSFRNGNHVNINIELEEENIFTGPIYMHFAHNETCNEYKCALEGGNSLIKLTKSNIGPGLKLLNIERFYRISTVSPYQLIYQQSLINNNNL